MFYPFALAISAPEIIGIVCIIAMVCSLIFFIVDRKKATKQYREDIEAMEEDTSEPEPVFVEATAVAKSAEILIKGTRTVSSERCFIVTFATENGERIELEVTEEAYCRIEKGQTGLLMTVNGSFIDFGEGQDIAEQENE